MSEKNRDTFTASTGVVLKLRDIPFAAAYDMNTLMSDGEPKPPKIWIEALQRYEENADSPEYKASMERFQARQISSNIDMAFLRGTSVLEIPEGVPAIEDDEWLEELQALNVPMPDSKAKRRLMWLKNVAVVKADEVLELTKLVTSRINPSEEEVKKK